MDPTVEENALSSTAGQPFTLVCSFMMPDNLIRPPIVQWLNSTGDVLSDSSSLYFPVLRTSHGGQYTCTVSISIPELDIELTEDGKTTITVLSKKLSPCNGAGFSYCTLCMYIEQPLSTISLLQFLHPVLTLGKWVCHSMAQSTSSPALCQWTAVWTLASPSPASG